MCVPTQTGHPLLCNQHCDVINDERCKHRHKLQKYAAAAAAATTTTIIIKRTAAVVVGAREI
jgi:hypothetical protein